ncbi:MAG: DUF4179 domain-containing protein [Acetivibrio sp.]
MNRITKRANQLKQEKKRRTYRILSLSSVMVCFFLIVGMALAMPDWMAQLAATEYTNTIGFGSIFSRGTSMGYLLIALLGFMLGICLTILCLYLHKRSQEDKKHD